MSVSSLLASFDALLGASARRGIQLPENVELFGYADAPLFHSIVIGTAGMGINDDQADAIVDFALQQPSTDCAPAIGRFATGLIGR